jgi:hypothetical protein
LEGVWTVGRRRAERDMALFIIFAPALVRQLAQMLNELPGNKEKCLDSRRKKVLLIFKRKGPKLLFYLV